MIQSKEYIIHQIASDIKTHIGQKYKNKSNIDWGLYTGLLGLIVFLFYYAKWTRKESDIQYADLCLEQYLESIPLTQIHYSYCSGLAGILVGLNHLNVCQFSDISISDVMPTLTEYIVQMLKLDINNPDFMHGTIGAGIMGNIFKCAEIQDILLPNLIQHMQIEGNAMWLTFKVFNESRYIENISMSHGMSSVVSYLAMLSAMDSPYRQEAQIVLQKCVNYILSQRYTHYNKVGSFFPYTSRKESICKSRLAWCYGDLGVGIALFNAGLIVNEKDWQKVAINILSKSTQRLNTPDNCVVDACFCHGSAGISQIYNRLYIETKSNNFLTAREYWIAETLKYSKFHDGLSGYKTVMGNAYINEYSLLEGIAGIGLSLLSSIDSTQYSSWDSLFLLNLRC